MSHKHFNPRPPRGGRRRGFCRGLPANPISIHAPREGGDQVYTGLSLFSLGFQSTPPARGATLVVNTVDSLKGHFNPRPPRGGRRRHICSAGWYSRFQSTPPARGATCSAVTCALCCDNFNPRPPRGGRPQLSATFIKIVDISIHAPREGGDTIYRAAGQCLFHISIHAPREGGDGDGAGLRGRRRISIHAPREGGDTGDAHADRVVRNFNPRPPRGGRLPANTLDGEWMPKFQSTPPARGATP